MEIKNTIYTFDDVKNVYSKYIHNPEELDKIYQAYLFASEKHKNQVRKSGDPYIVHLLGVARILSELNTGPTTIIAGLLHDTIEDTDTTEEEITEKFGKEVCYLVQGVTKVTRLSDYHNVDFEAESHRKIFIAMAKDIRVIIIKLADRLHNMRTLQFQPPEKQKKIAKETRDVYAPIAHRLGLSQVKTELEDLSLFYLEREKFEEIENLLSRQSTNMKNAIDVLKNKIVEILTPTNILFEITSRVKSIYSIYKKMYVKGKAFDDIYDIMALRIITETEMNCYELLGYIHANFKPIPGRFKDYIAMPKPNMYQSLHTTIVTGDGHTFEIQIRTKKMDEIAEEGVAAHWRYKENKKYDAKTEQQEIEEQLHWFRDFVSVTNEIQDGNAKEYVEALQHDIFDANVYVFTPKGKVVTLPNGSTPIDFAYKIHTDVGNTLAGAKVNNQMVPISRVLQTGDVVEIITNKNATPNSEWLNMATSSIAKSHIRKFLMKQNSDFIRQDNIQKGRNSLAVSFRERKIKANIDKIMTKKLFEHFNVENADELYLLLNSKTIMPLNIIEYLGLERSQEETLDDLKNNVNKRNVNRNIQDAVTLENGDRSLISLASCCTPIPGDDIIGYITKGNGIKVHRVSCPNVCQEHNRLIPVIWNPNAEKKDYPVDISIECYDRNNLLIDVLNCFSQIKVQVYKVNAKYHASNNTTTISVTVMVKDVAYLNTLTQQLLNINSVYDIRRVIH
ncbi:relA/SpoT family protein [Firmicutes bacterium CAG:345]|jgi:relA/spoT family protein|nr:relA/SpoT family protein [Firmicutes bacterium CAG:345]